MTELERPGPRVPEQVILESEVADLRLRLRATRLPVALRPVSVVLHGLALVSIAVLTGDPTRMGMWIFVAAVVFFIAPFLSRGIKAERERAKLLQLLDELESRLAEVARINA